MTHPDAGAPGGSLVWRALDLLFLLRPTILAPAWLFFLAGYDRAGDLGVVTAGGGGRLLLSLAAFTALLGGVNVVNALADVRSDRENRKVFLVADGFVPVRRARRLAGTLFLAGAVGAAFFESGYRWLFGLSMALGLAYSAPPFRWKGRAGLDFAANALGYGLLAFGVGWRTRGPLLATALPAALPYVAAAASLFVMTTLPDREGDARAGDRTLGVVLGGKVSHALALTLAAASAALGARAGDGGIALVALGVLPFAVRSLLAGERSAELLTCRMGVLFFAILLAVRFPLFGGWLLLVGLGTRWYHGRRWGLAYPSLTSR